jgi:hypothetical protein
VRGQLQELRRARQELRGCAARALACRAGAGRTRSQELRRAGQELSWACDSCGTSSGYSKTRPPAAHHTTTTSCHRPRQGGTGGRGRPCLTPSSPTSSPDRRSPSAAWPCSSSVAAQGWSAPERR